MTLKTAIARGLRTASAITNANAIAIAFAFPAAAAAAEASTPVPPAPTLLQDFATAQDPVCHQMVPGLAARPDFAVALQPRPVDVDATCRCVRAALLADPRLQAPFTGTPAEVSARINASDARLRSYLSARLVASALACTASALDHSLAVAPALMPAAPAESPR